MDTYVASFSSILPPLVSILSFLSISPNEKEEEEREEEIDVFDM